MATHHGEWFCGAVRIEVVGEPQALCAGPLGLVRWPAYCCKTYVRPWRLRKRGDVLPCRDFHVLRPSTARGH